ncbi:MAG: NADH-quinone oxidoreductase subunit C [Gammaproteobacteria bacterium]|nr:NADH-quinone oxidoreductase subunit C [Gammaproteobacteria bacterium]
MTDSVSSGSKARHNTLAKTLASEFETLGCAVKHEFSEVTLDVPGGSLLEVASRLRDDEAFQFEVLVDVCGVDYSAYGNSEWVTNEASSSGFGRGVESGGDGHRGEGERFGVVYHLLSISLNQRLRVRVRVDEAQPIVASVTTVWKSAEWFEREAFDLYGILFDGHEDLRRILTDYGFVGHPFRKDFPLQGNVEMRYDAEKGRVVYEPVSIEPRTLVPRVIREDNRYLEESQQRQDPADA